jgi:hypothetical protein
MMAQQHVLFQGGVAKFNGTVVKVVCRALRGLSHLRKYDFLNIVKTYIPLRFKKKNIINFYFYLVLTLLLLSLVLLIRVRLCLMHVLTVWWWYPRWIYLVTMLCCYGKTKQETKQYLSNHFQQQNLQYQQGQGGGQQYQGGQPPQGVQQNTQQFQQQQQPPAHGHGHHSGTGSFNQRENVHNSE